MVQWTPIFAAVVVAVVLSLVMAARRWANAPPGARPLPLLGNLLWLGPKPEKSLTAYTNRWGTVCSMRMGQEECVVISTPELVREAGKDERLAGRPRNYAFEIINKDGNEVTFGDFGPKWAMLRKILMGGLTIHLRSAQFEEDVQGEIAILTGKFDKAAAAGLPIDAHQHYHNLAMNFATHMVLKSRFEQDDPEFQKLFHILHTMDVIAPVVFSSSYFPDWFQKLYHRKYQNQWVDLVSGIMGQMSFYLERAKKGFKPEGESRDLIDDLLKKQLARRELDEGEEPLTDEQIYSILADTFAASTQTTSASMEWLLAIMATYPEVQRRAALELDTVLKGRTATLKDRENLPYFHACICEAHRWRTIAPWALPHKALVDTTLGGYAVPAGTTVLFNVHSIHTNPKYWPDAEHFNPEANFLGKNLTDLQQQAIFLPFSIGKRECPGRNVALNEQFLLYASLLTRYEFSVIPGQAPDLEGIFGGSFFPANFRVNIKRRQPVQ